MYWEEGAARNSAGFVFVGVGFEGPASMPSTSKSGRSRGLFDRLDLRIGEPGPRPGVVGETTGLTVAGDGAEECCDVFGLGL